MATHWHFPKFSKGTYVETPDGDGRITEIMWMDGKNYYKVSGFEPWYREDELKEF